jgi:hypothetical protein
MYFSYFLEKGDFDRPEKSPKLSSIRALVQIINPFLSFRLSDLQVCVELKTIQFLHRGMSTVILPITK